MFYTPYLFYTLFYTKRPVTMFAIALAVLLALVSSVGVDPVGPLPTPTERQQEWTVDPIRHDRNNPHAKKEKEKKKTQLVFERASIAAPRAPAPTLSAPAPVLGLRVFASLCAP